MKNTYIIPFVEAVECEVETLMDATSGVGGSGVGDDLGYGGIDDGTHEPASREDFGLFED